MEIFQAKGRITDKIRTDELLLFSQGLLRTANEYSVLCTIIVNNKPYYCQLSATNTDSNASTASWRVEDPISYLIRRDRLSEHAFQQLRAQTNPRRDHAVFHNTTQMHRRCSSARNPICIKQASEGNFPMPTGPQGQHDLTGRFLHIQHYKERHKRLIFKGPEAS